MSEIVYAPSDFVALLNQTLDYAYPMVTIEGELSNLRVARNKWVYFDIKDESASIKCFGTVYMLPGPLEDGMVVRIMASPRMHPLYNFSLNLQSIMPVGEGNLKRAADLLQAKLEKEGLFDPERKRSLPYAPEHVGLITSGESAAYADFMKILNERWSGVTITHYDAQVQGEQGVTDIVAGITAMNRMAELPEVLVVTRGGGSTEDLAVFSTEPVVRAVAASRIPTLVAIGHEVDISLAELAADMRASTPSNAVQLLVPDKQELLQTMKHHKSILRELLSTNLKDCQTYVKDQARDLHDMIKQAFLIAEQTLARQTDLLDVLNPESALKRGYAVVRSEGKVIKSVKNLKKGSTVSMQLVDGTVDATVNKVQ